MVSFEISASTLTTAPPERIFTVLDDFGRWPTWMPSFERVRVELPPGQEPGPGYRFRLQATIIHADMEVVDFTPLSRATHFRISFPPFTGINRCQVVPLADGQYRIERVDSLDLPDLVVGLIGPAQRQRFVRLANEFLVALKREVETPNP
ncbi:MAG: SRPBCC family protein [Oscillochloridaceae bacterium umkhey_bin13]